MLYSIYFAILDVDNPSLQQEDLKMISPAKENEEGRQEDLIEKETAVC